MVFIMQLTNEQKEKLDAIIVENLSEDALKQLIRVFKIVKGEEAKEEFEYEYDFDLDEETYVNVPLDTFKDTCPIIYGKITAWDGNQIFKAMEGNKFSKIITNEKLHKEKLEEIKNNDRISKSKRDKQISIRKDMRKEYEALKEINGHLNSNTCWKVWRITQGDKTRKDLTESLGEEKLAKEIAKVEYLGEDFINQCKEIAYPEEEE